MPPLKENVLHGDSDGDGDGGGDGDSDGDGDGDGNDDPRWDRLGFIEAPPGVYDITMLNDFFFRCRPRK